ncbi:MAG: methyltransferase domain-containing protein [Gomphosphaeria aponina SAG 52.96 = DSM 107014]|uniref:Methyltransferase domain-containing protein n=1 Tax=Gomphosphaeria aponina SAG 52.96 = DSM 107014 TaxID=1521640 RepID=A0A941GVG1_9CHRO|nr:methyltransferase domain-containing protein [Gomphosphaeria aponina SAG 52.96 = DSM 107014]
MAKSLEKWQFGDFQTPEELAKRATKLLREKHKIFPDLIIEPTCGKGAFLRASLSEFKYSKIVGFDISEKYVEEAKSSLSKYLNSGNATVCAEDFFSMDWNAFLADFSGYILVIGNPPWVTSSDLSILNSNNLPSKSNFQSRRGMEAITGSGNFDISEWMLLQHAQWLTKREGTIALLCKYSVARKVIKQVRKKLGNRFSAFIYLIDAKAFFGASVAACFFVLSTNGDDSSDCKVYNDLKSPHMLHVISERDGLILKDTAKYEKWKHLSGQDLRYTWRSGIKHDCSKVMELEQVENGLFLNGMGQKYFLEKEYLYPLLKSSDIGNSRTNSYRKLVLVTQKSVGDDTSIIKNLAPNTWQYLLEHDELLKRRKSSIYKNKPRYSIFGVGEYSFKKWKIAVSGLYKKLNFCIIKPIDNRAVMLDDTVNFLSFEAEEEANFILSLITSKASLEFLDSMIFWDEKRPITIDILKRLSLKAVAKELGLLERYLQLAEVLRANSSG